RHEPDPLPGDHPLRTEERRHGLDLGRDLAEAQRVATLQIGECGLLGQASRRRAEDIRELHAAERGRHARSAATASRRLTASSVVTTPSHHTTSPFVTSPHRLKKTPSPGRRGTPGTWYPLSTVRPKSGRAAGVKAPVSAALNEQRSVPAVHGMRGKNQRTGRYRRMSMPTALASIWFIRNASAGCEGRGVAGVEGGGAPRDGKCAKGKEG